MRGWVIPASLFACYSKDILSVLLIDVEIIDELVVVITETLEYKKLTTDNILALHVFLGDLNLTAGIDMYLTRVKKYSSFL